MSNQDQELRDGLLAVIRHSGEPMAISDPNLPDNPIVAVNAAFTALTGYTEAEMNGRNCRLLQGKGTDPETVRRMGESLRAGQGCVQWLVNYRRDGSQFWNLLFLSPVFGAGGRLLYFFANQHDLSGEIPLELPQFTLGTAHMPERQQSEFHALLADIGRARHAPQEQAGQLEQTLAGARQVAAMSLQLAGGPAQHA